MRGRAVLISLTTAGVVAGALVVTAPGASAATTATGVVSTGGIALNVRAAPSSAAKRVGTLAHGRTFTIACQKAGQTVSGKVRTTTLWDRLPNGTYVSDAYVKRSSAPIPVCDKAAPTQTTTTPPWVLPVAAVLGSAFRSPSRPSHDGVDFPAAKNTPIRAAAAGTVIRVVCQTNSGNCDVDGAIGAGGCGWYAEVQHADAVVTRYCHMIRRPSVTLGQIVKAGQLLGYVGTSGNSSGPHLHFEIHQQAAPATHANAVDPVPFLKARGVVVPTATVSAR
jgi:murein DD-endopeptidase MepM/ murein hydrolase activator NlpD